MILAGVKHSGENVQFPGPGTAEGILLVHASVVLLPVPSSVVVVSEPAGMEEEEVGPPLGGNQLVGWLGHELDLVGDCPLLVEVFRLQHPFQLVRPFVRSWNERRGGLS